MNLRSALALGLLTATATATGAGCTAGKGDEDNPLSDGKADSFFSPTEHGALLFGEVPNRAEITDDERFHAWTFELDGPATLSIRTEISGNLDTVMYLYRRDLGSAASFGHFIRKNDDHDGDLFSQIDLDGEAGEYRVIVKGFKAAHRGPFAVLATCDGDGCPTDEACESGKFAALPAAPDGLTADCASNLLDTLSGAAGASGDTSVSESEVCSLDPLGKRSVDLFRGYWDDVIGWDGFKEGEEDIGLEVTKTVRGDGTEVLVDTDPFDEDAISFYFDAAGQLLLLYQHNQSPDARAFCDASGDIAAPDVGCTEDMRDALPHTDSEKTGQGTTDCTGAAGADFPPLVTDPVCEFTGRLGLADDAAVDVSYRTWGSENGLLGAEVTLESGGHSGTFYLGTTFIETTKVLASDVDGELAFDCLEL